MEAEKPRRNTQQRRVILEELRKLSSHPTAAELYEITRRRLPRISLGTVYRNLDLLSRMGLIKKIENTGAEARFDGDLGWHRHVRCLNCGKIDDIHGMPADLVSFEVQNLTSYKILGHRLEFLGICPECKEGREEPPEDDSSMKQN